MAQCLRCWCLALICCYLLRPEGVGAAAAGRGAAAAAAAAAGVSLHTSELLARLQKGKDARLSAHQLWGQGAAAADVMTPRVLRQQQPILDADPACAWSKEGDDEQGQCYPLPANWLAPGGFPSSPYRRVSLMALERDRFCGRNTKEAPCVADTAHRCFWDLSSASKPMCSGSDVVEVSLLSSRNFNVSVDNVPLGMICPGTLAYNFFTCYNFFGGLDACSSLPACASIRVGQKRACMPKILLKMRPQELTEFFDDIYGFAPKVYGTCAAACWLNQARQCIKATNTSRVMCEKKAFCDWRPADNVCLHRIIELGNDFDKKVYRLYAMCVEIDNQRDCEFNSVVKISEAAAARWRNHTEPPDAVECKL